jgi:hypothetical protein
VSDFAEERFLKNVADRVGFAGPEPAPVRLKAQIYSALVQEQAATGTLMSLTESQASGRKLCIFETLVRIAPVGEPVKCLNFCRVCHARILAEHMNNAPIYWSGCPYVEFKKS